MVNAVTTTRNTRLTSTSVRALQAPTRPTRLPERPTTHAIRVYVVTIGGQGVLEVTGAYTVFATVAFACVGPVQVEIS